MVLTDKGDVIKYDILSFNIGSNIDTMLKANQKFEKVIDSLKERECVVIVGGSASSVELALSLQSLRKKRGHLLAPILVSSSSLLSETSKNISTKIEKICKEKGLKVITNERAINVTANEVITNHEQIAYDELLWMEDPKAPDLFQVSKLPVDRNGNLLVEDTLQVKKFPTIFGAGDGVTVRRFEQPFINAEYAKQQAPILWTNIKAIIDGADDGERFISPKNDVSILSTGDSEGLLRYGDWAIHSKWCFTLKTIIDRKFIRQYQ
jgi:NADH dehydrogenase FAD-containing subunit